MPGLIENIRSRTLGKMLKGSLIHMGNVHLHRSRQTQRRIDASRAECLPHPAYRPDLASSEFFLFGHIK
jgi:hypothetical protein